MNSKHKEDGVMFIRKLLNFLTIIILVVGVVGIIAFIYVPKIDKEISLRAKFKDNVSDETFDEIIRQTDKGFDYVNSEKDNRVKVRIESQTYDDIHRMANTKIIAVDGEIWGEDEINEDRLNKVILEVMKSKYPDRKYLLEMLYRWKNKDFTKCVEEHNYVWDKLGGTIGKAKALKESVVPVNKK